MSEAPVSEPQLHLRPCPPSPDWALEGSPHALGRSCVDAAQECAAYAAHGYWDKAGVFTGERSLGVDTYLQSWAHHTLAAERWDLSKLSYGERYLLAGQLALGEVPRWLQAAVEGNTEQERESSDMSLLTFLVRESEASVGDSDEAGDYLVPDATFLNVMQWHNFRLSERQKRFAEEVGDPQKSSFADQVEAGASWLPASAADKLARLDRTTIYLDDGSQTILRGDQGSSGVNGDGSRYVLIAPGKIPDLLFEHELTHVIAGEDPPADFEPDHAYERKSGLKHFFGDSEAGEELAETLVDLIAVSLKYGYTGSMDLSGKNRKMERYSALPLLQTLSRTGIKPIDLTLFMAVELEGFDEHQALGEQSAWSKLERAFRRSFPGTDIKGVVGALGTSKQSFAEDMNLLEASLHRRYRFRQWGRQLLSLRNAARST